MKKYFYYGSSTLAFTHDGQDYLISGKGPHSLPETADQVVSAVGLSLLEEEVKQVKAIINQETN
jgi:hypothetical protein